MPSKQRAAGASSTGALVLGLVALAFGFAAGYVAGEKLSGKARYAMPDGTRTTASQPTGLEPGDVPAPPRGEIRNVQGTIVSVSGDTMRVDARLAGAAAPTQLTAMLTASTTYSRRVELSAEEFDAALRKFASDDAAFSAAAAKGTEPGAAPRPPEPFRDMPASKSDLKAGLQVNIRSLTPLGDGMAFDAESVAIIEGLPTPPPEPAATAPTE